MLLAKLRALANGLLRRSNVESEMAQELESHIEAHAEHLVARRGLSREEAMRQARIEFGSVEKYKEEGREARGLRIFDELRRDLTYAGRMLRKNPGFAITAIVTLALGIGANTAIFSAVNALLFHPAGVSEPDRVVAVLMNVENLNLRNSVISPRDFTEVRDSKEVFATAAILQMWDFSYTAGGLPERLAGNRVTWQWFDVLQAKPILGRPFRQEEDQPNANHVVILGYRTWQRLFGGDVSILEKTIQLDQLPYKVVGVMGPEHDIGMNFTASGVQNHDIFVPLGLPAADYAPENRFNQSYVALARLQPGVPFDKAQAFMGVLTERGFQDPFGDEARKQGWRLFITPYTEFVAGDLKTPMYVLFGSVGFVLLIACSNIAGLTLARASGRSREFAVRTALGASRWHLVRQALVESLVLSLSGSILGLGVAYASIQAAMVLAPESVIGRLYIQPNIMVLLFTAGVGILSGLLFGVAPAWQVARTNTHDALKEGGRSGMASRGRLRLRSALVTAEVALALVLLVGAGLFLRSLFQLQQVDLGFQPKDVMSGVVTLPESRYKEPERQIALYRAAVERMAALPGVTSAAAALPMPFLGAWSSSFRILGRQLQEGAPEPLADVRFVTPGLFSTLQIPLKKGRLFTDLDTTATERVVIIDENLARQHWPNADPIGQQIQHSDGRGPSRIVGVVGHVKPSLFAGDSGRGAAYHPMYQRPTGIAALIVRTDADAAGLAGGMREAMRSVDPAQPIYELRTMEDRVAETLGVRRFAVILLGLFAAIALFMAALGLYGVINYGVTQRTQEIGIRMALGAQCGQVLSLIIGQGLRMTLMGVGLGLIAALGLAQLVSSQLFGVSAFDPVTFAGMATVLIVVALLASYIPARRAARVNPMEACRYE